MAAVVSEQASAALRIVTLNRPKKLNALDLGMVHDVTREMVALVEACRGSAKCATVVMRGAGGKAFCAGGDVAAVRASGLEGGDLRVDFFREEYRMNALLGSLGAPASPIKQVSLWDGIVMGGGVGISAHGRFRVATERSLLAMPETQIGLFPDVGASRLLARMGPAGAYVGLTGARLKAADLLASGLATHYVPSEEIDALIEDLKALPAEGDALALDAAVEAVLASKHVSPPDPPSLDGPVVDAFAHDTVEAIIDALAAVDGGAPVVATLGGLSPTSLKVALESIARARHADLFDVLKTDLRLAAHLTDPALAPLPDFYEGVRAILVDKDKNPQWRATLADLSTDDVQRHFLPASGVPDLDFSGIPLFTQ